MKKTITLLLLLAWLQPLSAQPINHASLDVNNVDAGFNADGSLFWDFDDPKFRVPKSGQAHAIFAAALWLGGVDAGGDLHLSAQTYRQTGTDFWPGPLDSTGSTTQSISDDWNYIWKVSRSQINQHILDYANNGVINGPIPNAILHWPALGNLEATGATGANLIITEPMAPFVDVNGDGIYTPRLGDYPLIKGDEALWWVYNDTLDAHTETEGRAFGVEIRTMAYAFACISDGVLDNTIFVQYEIVNKSANDYFDFRAAMYTDLEVGCFNNDYFGCNPALDYFYGYNGVDSDSTCATIGYDADMGMSVTVVLGGGMPDISGNATGMSSFVYPGFHPNVSWNPFPTLNHNNLISGLWSDGTPLTRDSCMGYGGSIPTKFLYPDPPGGPAFPASWSECACNNTPADRRGLGSTGAGVLPAGGSISLTFGFGYYSHGTQVGCAAPRPDAEVQHLHDLFNSDFQNACGSCISDTCVWPGDANSDGVANNFDVLELGIAAGSVGPVRPGANIFWTGQSGTPWSNTYANGTNYQHADCNGDGTVDANDLVAVNVNYGFTHFKTDPTLKAGAVDPFLFISTLQDTVPLNAAVAVPIHLGTVSTVANDIYGIAFTVNIDVNLIQPGTVYIDFDSCWLGTISTDLFTLAKVFATGQIDIGISRTDGISRSLYGNIATVHFITTDNLSGKSETNVLLPMSISHVRIINAQEQAIPVNVGWDTLVVTNRDIGIGSLANDLSASIYPNPTQKQLNVLLPHVKLGTAVRLSIFNTVGVQKESYELPYQSPLSISLGDLPTGVYYLKIEAGGKQVSKKVMVF